MKKKVWKDWKMCWNEQRSMGCKWIGPNKNNSPLKIQAVKRFPIPTNAKTLQRFLGLTSYFRKFVKNYSTIAKPLSDLLRNETNFVFGSKKQLAFQTLKEKLTNGSVFMIYNQETETELHYDASKYGYGAVLLQTSTGDDKFHPVYYMS